MKRELCSFVLVGLLATGVVFAQQPTPAQEQRTSLQAASRASVLLADPLSKKSEKRLVHMSKRYRLTPQQQAQVRSILFKEEQDIQTVSADTLMSGGNKREEVAGLQETSQQKIGVVLTRQQKHKFDADEKRRAWMDGRLPEPNPGPALNGGW
jgi:Spy/CpxP family protein refolding chaperone